ncbi:MAG: hypothetical protein H6711_09135 [Myxococcales bacterium]|nr:hypothetical protein [Myxococcales bacterium]
MALGLALGLQLGSGCAHRSLERMVARGELQEAVDKAAKRRRPPKRRAARAYAEALAGLERLDEARAVLLRDFRTTGEVASMVALADLEASIGARGMAAVHYGRAMSLDAAILAGRDDVCELLRQRAALFFDRGEALAADQDLRRVALLCPSAPGSTLAQRDADLAAKVRAEAEADARAIRALQGCEDGSCVAGRSARAGAIEVALATARARGARALRATARELRVQVSPEDVVRLLAAELDGELGVSLVANDELRAWIGELSIEEIQRATSALTGDAEQAYVRLRLGRLGPGYALPVAADAPGSEAALVTLTLEDLDRRGPQAGALGWRVLALIGDLPGAEMALVSALRGGDRPPGEAAAEPSQSAVPVPNHWAGRVAVRPGNWRLLLVVARLRANAGRADQALEISRHALAEARAQGFVDVDAFARDEAHDALAAGRPWQAMAIADAVGGIEVIDGPASAAILLERSVCADGCGEAEDRAVVAGVVGDAWVAAREARLIESATRRRFAARGSVSACPGIAELLASDAVGPTADALRSLRSGDLRTEPMIRAAIEADLGLACAGQLLAPVMIDRGYRVAARILVDNLSQAPQMVAADQLALSAELALAADEEERARALLDAAAGSSPEPAKIWRRAARLGRLAGAREVELMALRNVLMHAPSDADARWAHEALLVRALADANAAWATRGSELGRESLTRAVADYLDRFAAAERWWAREELARALADERWRDAEAIATVRAAVWPEPELAYLHPAASLRLEASLRGGGGGRIDPLSPDELATAVAAGGPPSAIERFFAASDLVALRLARLGGGALDGAGRRQAIAVLVSGEREERQAALGLLLEALRRAGEDAGRRALEDLILAEPAALAPGADTNQAIVGDPDVLIELLLGIGERGRAEAEAGAGGTSAPAAGGPAAGAVAGG